jgi:mannose-6-phosphate isomerase-like protein (cupin superfamily)
MDIVTKLWGHEHILHNGDFCMKKMQLRPMFQCSIHRHPCKDEAFYITDGQIILELGDDPEKLETFFLGEGDYKRVPPGTWHRFRNVQSSTAVFIEASTYDDQLDCERHTPSGPIEI